jgi:HSP20 family protein
MTDLIRKDPFDVSFRNFFGRFFDEPFLSPFFRETEGKEQPLALDISEGKEGEVIVRASVPGFKKEEITLDIHNDMLTVRAEHKEEKVQKDEHFIRRERSFGSYSRTVSLPGISNGENAEAVLEDGVLRIKIPRIESKSRKIKIK